MIKASDPNVRNKDGRMDKVIHRVASLPNSYFTYLTFIVDKISQPMSVSISTLLINYFAVIMSSLQQQNKPTTTTTAALCRAVATVA